MATKSEFKPIGVSLPGGTEIIDFRGEGVGRHANCLPSDAENARRSLHAKGLTDREIAERLNVSMAAIGAWRYRRGLKVNPVKKFNTSARGTLKLDRQANARRMALYRQGLTDREIAEREGVTVSAIKQWRYVHHIWPKEWGAKHDVFVRAEHERVLLRRFFSDLITVANAAQGKRVDVGRFMKAWREVGACRVAR